MLAKVEGMRRRQPIASWIDTSYSGDGAILEDLKDQVRDRSLLNKSILLRVLIYMMGCSQVKVAIYVCLDMFRLLFLLCFVDLNEMLTQINEFHVQGNLIIGWTLEE